ncbi:MAG: hypothetical protein Q9219_006279, partial [cf. Caloplaca sp. 3 TL-2023]
FHGILQDRLQTFDDGAQGLGQSAIAGGLDNKFKYTFLADKPGTYWIHSHAPGQYPQGVRTPLIVTDTGDPASLGYTAGLDKTVTLSDWWPDFQAAEERGKSHGGTWTGGVADEGTCGDPANPNGYGIEFPAEKMLFNDVGGHNAALGAPAKTIELDCDPASPKKMRIRFVNLASHSRFYVWFADNRKFNVVELDGISYQGLETDIFEVSSGQRVSIVVSGMSPSNVCASTYIIAASDPKVAHGTVRCPMKFTRPDRGVQWTHGYFSVKQAGVVKAGAAVYDVIPAGENIALDRMLRVWALPSLTPPSNDPNKYRNFQPYPSGSWDPMSVAELQNRINLKYRQLWYQDDSAEFNKNFGAFFTGRDQQAIIGLEGSDDLAMQPKNAEAPWFVPQTNKEKYMHYISLGIVDSSSTSDKKGGFAAMAENFNTLFPWASPDQQTFPSDHSKPPLFSSLLRTLDASTTDQTLKTDPTFYESDKTNHGRTTIIPDGSGNHWFILRSNIGDHPMHLHGHHFQILAKLPRKWFDAPAADLWAEVTNPHEANRAFPINLQNPPKRDTIMIEKGVTYVIAIKPDNPGVWAFHCHNDIHAVSGMMSQIIERPAELRAAVGNWKTVTPTGTSPPEIQFVWTPGTGKVPASGSMPEVNGYTNTGSPTVSERVKRNLVGAMVRWGWERSKVGWRVASGTVRRDRKSRRSVEA